MTKELLTAFDDIFAKEDSVATPVPVARPVQVEEKQIDLEDAIQAAAENFDYNAVEAIVESAEEEEEESASSEPTPPSVPEVPLHTRFTAVRNRLLELEKMKLRNEHVDLKEVQDLVKQCADLMAQIQTATTGPKKKPVTIDGATKGKTSRVKKASTIAHLNIPEGDDF
jgi:hypothetical protein